MYPTQPFVLATFSRSPTLSYQPTLHPPLTPFHPPPLRSPPPADFNETIVAKEKTILQVQHELHLLQQSLDIAREAQTTMKKEIDDRKSTASEDVARWCDTSVLELEGKVEAMNDQFDAACRRIASLEAEKEVMLRSLSIHPAVNTPCCQCTLLSMHLLSTFYRTFY